MKNKILILLLIIFSSIFYFGCQGIQKNKEDFGLNTIGNAETLKSLIRKTQNSYNYRGGNAVEDDAEAPTDEQSKSNDYTKTNVQVEGIDEGDIVKTDGERIYSLTYSELHVVSVDNGNMEILLDESIKSEDPSKNDSSYTYYSELYVTDKYLVVIGQKYQYHIMQYSKDVEPQVKPEYDGGYYYYYSVPTSVVTIYDLSTLEVKSEYETSGYLLGSRLIEDNLYLISSYYCNNYILEDDKYDPRPFVINNGQEEIIDYEDIKYKENTVYESFTLISNFNLDETITHDTNTFLGAATWGIIYVNLSGIYLAYTTYNYSLFGNYTETGTIISYQFDEDGKVIYGGSGNYKGYIINQFAMDEYNGYLRIVTTEGWGQSTKNRLYVFQREFNNENYELKVVGKIEEGLGKPNERVQSVRFNKDIATVVTYEQTDPFYTIDLSNPKNPVIKGALEVPGFSTYQHPWKDNYIIGIGFDAVDGRTTGMKLSLYDISDKENPKEVGKSLILSQSTSNSWSYSEALYNHKALYIDPTHNSFGFALWRSTWNEQYYSQTNDYIIFDVDENRNTPIQIKGTINHLDYYKDLYNNEYYYWDYNFTINRALRINDYLYVLSNEIITSHNLVNQLSTVDAIIFNDIDGAKESK